MGNSTSQKSSAGPSATPFTKSNYKKHLLQIEKGVVNRMEFHDVIEEHLGKLPEQGLKQAYKSVRQSHPDELPPLIAVRVWTGNSLYGVLKKALMTDDDTRCRLLAPYMRALNHHLVMQNPCAMVTFRGSKMDASDLHRLHGAWKSKKSLKTRVPSYYPSSLLKEEAEKFATNNYLVKFHIPAGCPNCCHIEPWSFYKNEQEVLFPPWTAFKIIKVDPSAPDGVVLEVEVLDNLVDWLTTDCSNGTKVPGVVGIESFDSLQVVGITECKSSAEVVVMMSASLDSKEKYSA